MSSRIPPWLSHQKQGLKRPAGPSDLESEQPPKRLVCLTTNYTHRYYNEGYTLTPSSHARVSPVNSGDTFTAAYATDYVEPTIISNSERLQIDQHYNPPTEIQRDSLPILEYPPMPNNGNPTPIQTNDPLVGNQSNPYIRINIYDDVNCPNVDIPPFSIQPQAELILDVYNGPFTVNDRILNEFNLAIDKIVEEIKEANKRYSYKLNNGDTMSALRWEIRERMFKVMQNKPILSKYNIYNCYRSAYHTDSDSELFRKECRLRFPDSYGPLPQTEPSEIFNGPDSVSLPVLSTIQSAVDEIVVETINHIKSVIKVKNKDLMNVKPFVRDRIYKMLMGKPVLSYRHLMDTYRASYNIKGYDLELRSAMFRKNTGKGHKTIIDPRTAAERSTVFTGPRTATDGTLIFLANTALSLVRDIPAKVSQLEMMGLKWRVLERLYELIMGSTVPSASNLRNTYKRVHKHCNEYKLVGYVRSTKFKRTVPAMDLYGLEEEITKLQSSTESSDSAKLEELADILLKELSRIQSTTVKFHSYTLKFLVRYRVYTLFEGKPLPMNLYDEYRKDYDIQSDRDLLSDVLRGRTNWIFADDNDDELIEKTTVHDHFSQNVVPVRPVELQQDVRTQTHEKVTEMKKNTIGLNTNSSSENNQVTCSVLKDINKADLLRIHSAADKIINNLNTSNLNEQQRTQFKSAVRERFYKIVKGKEVPTYKELMSGYRKNYNVRSDSTLLAYILTPQLSNLETVTSTLNVNACTSTGEIPQHSITEMLNDVSTTGLCKMTNMECQRNEHNLNASLTSVEVSKMDCQEIQQNISKLFTSNDIIHIDCEENEHNSVDSVSNEKMIMKCDENEQNFVDAVISNEKMIIKCEDNEQNSVDSVISNEKMNIKCDENEQNSVNSVISNEKMNIKCDENEQNSVDLVISNGKMNIKCDENEQNSSCSVMPNEKMNIKCEENEQSSSGPVIPNDIIYIDCEENGQNSSNSVILTEKMNIECERNEHYSSDSVKLNDMNYMHCEGNCSSLVKINEKRNTDCERNEHISNNPYSVSKTVLLSINKALNKIIEEMKLDSLKIQDYQKAQIQLLVQERLVKIFKRKWLYYSEELVCEYRTIHNDISDHNTVEQIKTDSIFSGPEHASKTTLEIIESIVDRIIVEMDLDFSQMPGTYEKVKFLVRQRMFDMCMGTKLSKPRNLYKRYRKTYTDVNDIKLIFNLTNKKLTNATPTNLKPISTEATNIEPTNILSTNEGPTNEEIINIELINGDPATNQLVNKKIVPANEEPINKKFTKTKQHLIFNGPNTANNRAMNIIKGEAVIIVNSMNEACRDMSDLDLTYLKFMVRERLYKVAMGISLQGLGHLVTLYRQHHNVESDSQLVHDISTRTHSKKFAHSYHKLHELYFGSLKSAEIDEKVKPAENFILDEISTKNSSQFHFYDIFIKWIVRYRTCTIIKTYPEILNCNVYNVYRHHFRKETDYLIFNEINLFASIVVSEKGCQLQSDHAWSNNLNRSFNANSAAFKIMKSAQDEIKNRVSEVMSNELDKLLNSCACTQDKDKATSSAAGTPADVGIFEKTVRRLMHQHLQDIKSDLTSVIANDGQLYSSLGMLTPYDPSVRFPRQHIKLTGNPQLPSLDTMHKYLKSKFYPLSFHIYRNMKNVMFVDCTSNNRTDKLLMNPIVIDGNQISATLVPPLLTKYMSKKLKIPNEEQCQMDIELDKTNERGNRNSEICTEDNLELTTDSCFDKSIDELDDQSKILNSNLVNERCAKNNFNDTMKELGNQSNVSNLNLSNEICAEKLSTDLQDFDKIINKLDDQLNDLFMAINHSDIMEAHV